MTQKQRMEAVNLFAEWRLDGHPLLLTREQALALANEHDVDLSTSSYFRHDEISLAQVAKFVSARKGA